jgi:high-affinity iron transporter
MRRTLLIILVLAGILTPRLTAAHEATGNPHKDLYDLNSHIEEAMIAIAAGDVAKARAEYTHFDEGWLKIEDGVREYSKQSYRDIEGAMSDVKVALKQEPLDAATATSALEALVAADDAFIDTAGAAITSSGQQLPTAPITIASELPKLDEALDALATGDLRYARAEIEEFRTVWPQIKGVVEAQDSAAYARAEQLQAQASAQIASGQIQAAIATVGELKQILQPFTTTSQASGVSTTMNILLREGSEALVLAIGIGAVVLVAIGWVKLSQGKRV